MADQGRPSKYDPAFCDQIVEIMGQGYSKMAAAGHLGVCYDTVRNWMDQYPDFFQAVKRGEALRCGSLEREMLGAQNGHTVTARIFALKNAAPDEWRDRREHDLSSSDGSMSGPSIVILCGPDEDAES